MREGVCGGECIVYIYKCILGLGVGRKGTLLCLSYIKWTLAYTVGVIQISRGRRKLGLPHQLLGTKLQRHLLQLSLGQVSHFRPTRALCATVVAEACMQYRSPRLHLSRARKWCSVVCYVAQDVL